MSLVLVDEIMFLEKSIEGGFGFIKRVTLLQDFVVVGATVSVVENLESFVDFVELSLSLLPIVLIALRQPLIGQSFIGHLDVISAGCVRHSERLIVILDRRTRRNGHRYNEDILPCYLKEHIDHKPVNQPSLIPWPDAVK